MPLWSEKWVERAFLLVTEAYKMCSYITFEMTKCVNPCESYQVRMYVSFHVFSVKEGSDRSHD